MSDRPELHAAAFSEFFQSLYGCPPFRWQTRLTEQVCHGDWPWFIKLPTSSGKTSCLDIAVFALAHQAWRRHSTQQAVDAPRRIFFVVDRRIIVNEAYQRARNLACQLQDSLKNGDSPLYPVAWWLRQLAGNDHAPPLDYYELRGGIYRDDAWVRSLLQPTIVTSTIDQVGSRLLFRGYGVPDRNLPIHAALTANNSLIVLDEAHCSTPFSQTMAAITRYRDMGLALGENARWAEEPLHTPFRFVEMTATPRSHGADEVFQLEEADYQADPPLNDRHGCAKPIGLKESNAKGGKQNQMLAKHLVEHAESLAQDSDGKPRCLRIAIVVNRVECARRAFDLLREKYPGRVELMIGRMRPIDRDRLTKTLQETFRSGSQELITEPRFVVATQCLEVGADFDFDGMVCQCASLDALRQRFGRLNRLGNSPDARGIIVMAEGDKAPRKPDPIYGESLPATWKWLQQQAVDNTVDFGVRSLDAVIANSRIADASAIDGLSSPTLNAPVLMPAHLDMLCQTAPRPALEPEIAPYLHGPNRGVPEVRICWRADLPERNRGQKTIDEWLNECQQTLTVCPPSSAECLSLPLPQFKTWLQDRDENSFDDSGDLLGEELADDDEVAANSRSKSGSIRTRRWGVAWNGRECRAVSGAANELDVVTPQALIVLPVTAGGWSTLGYLPGAPPEPTPDSHEADTLANEQLSLATVDEATDAFERSRNRLILRVHRGLITNDADRAALQGLWDFLEEENLGWNHSLLRVAVPAQDTTDETNNISLDQPASTASEHAARLLTIREQLGNSPPQQVRVSRYPGGFVVIGPRLSLPTALPRASFDDDFDEHNVDAASRVRLSDHLADVAAETERIASSVELSSSLRRALVVAAERHDLGKADLRFQAMLLNSSLDMAAMQPALWAKSARGIGKSNPGSLPSGFRHEMLSVELAQRFEHDLAADSQDVMLHTIAAHHGHARPFAPVVIDESPPDVDLSKLIPRDASTCDFKLSSEERGRCPAHRLNSGIAERFWKLNHRFGWWGLAWVESILRLADWTASAQPLRPFLQPRELIPVRDGHPQTSTPMFSLDCVGLNGGNPLGFLATLGLLRHFGTVLDSRITLRWQIANGSWTPTLTGSHPVLKSKASLLDWLYDSLSVDPDKHWLKWLNELPDERLTLLRPSEFSHAAEQASVSDRQSADWLSCNGSDLCDASSNNQLQTARRDYFPESATAIIRAVTHGHLERTLFKQWDYGDPIQKVSLHLEPREDRRHAYQWHKPVGDPTRSLRGGMVGANRLAMEAWPLLQSVALRSELQTVGFQGTRPMKGIRWTWPLWTVPLALSVITPLLNLRELQKDTTSDSLDVAIPLRERGIATAFRLRRILVEKTPNFTPAVALFTIGDHRLPA